MVLLQLLGDPYLHLYFHAFPPPTGKRLTLGRDCYTLVKSDHFGLFSIQMIFSRKTDYGILLIDTLRESFHSGEFMGISEIAEKNAMPRMFLEKLAQLLKANGIVESKKGKTGGYRLIKDPKKLSLLDIIRIFENEENIQCVKSPRPNQYCPLSKFSPANKRWGEIDKKINQIFQEATFA